MFEHVTASADAALGDGVGIVASYCEFVLNQAMDQNGVGAQKRGRERVPGPMFDSFPAWGCMRFMPQNFWRGPVLSSDPDFFAPEPHFEQNPASLEPSCSLG